MKAIVHSLLVIACFVAASGCSTNGTDTAPSAESHIQHHRLDSRTDTATATGTGDITADRRSAPAAETSWFSPTVYRWAAAIIAVILTTIFVGIENYRRDRFTKWLAKHRTERAKSRRNNAA